VIHFFDKTHKKVQNTGQETRVLIENGHPAIIDRELFNKAQALRESRLQASGYLHTCYILHVSILLLPQQ